MYSYTRKHRPRHFILLTLPLLLSLADWTRAAGVKDLFSPLTRVPREGKYSRYSGESGDKSLKPENTSDGGAPALAVGKRCIRCDSEYEAYDRRRGYEDRSRDYDRYDDRYLDRDRYYDRDRYDRYSDRSRGQYGGRDRYYGSQDRYGGADPYRSSDRYGGLDSYRSPDRYGTSDRYGPDRYGADRYGTDRYGTSDRYGDRYRDFDPYERYDKYDRYSDRGVGYDNRGYDYRGSDSGGYRPWDETYRGTSGFDNSGRGYYFASGRPDYGSSYSGGYANGWNYGSSGSGRDDYYRDRGYGGYATYRPLRDPYDTFSRPTSYLYGRPSSTTLKTPSTADDGTNTPSPQENSG